MNVCLFDIDGTLISTSGAGRAAMETALVEEFSLSRLVNGVPMSGRTDRAIARDLFHAHQLEDSPENWQRFLAAYMRILPQFLAGRAGRVLPGIASFLDQLSSRSDVAVGLLTGNVESGARVKLEYYRIFQHFRFGGFGDVHFDRNDVAREALAEVRRHCRAPVDLADVWVIGDTPLDVRCARAIGARSVAVATGGHSTDELAPEQPDLLLRDLSDPQPLVRQWG